MTKRRKYIYTKQIKVINICLIIIVFFSCKQKHIEHRMEGIEQQIINLSRMGITANCILKGDTISKSFINNVKEFETNSGVENWIILREMGGFCNWKTKERNANNVSTIIYDDFFFYFKISTIFSELNRITNNRGSSSCLVGFKL